MSHTTKIPPAKYATSDLPTDVAVGTIVFDETTSEHKSFNGSSWDAIEGGGIGTQTIVFDSTGPSYDQIQGDIPANWKTSDPSLKGLVIGTSCTSIGSSAFYNCPGLTSLVIPNSVTSIGNYAFGFCTNITGPLVIPNSVTSIGNYAFGFCTNITGTLVIPNSVTSIGSSAFYNCPGLTTAYLAPPLANVGSDAFFFSGLTTIYAKDAVANGWTLGAGQTVGGKTGVTVIDWTNYPVTP